MFRSGVGAERYQNHWGNGMNIDGLWTRLKRGMKALLESESSSEDRFRQLFEKMPEPVWIVTDTHFVEANPAALAAIGYKDRPDFLHLHPAEVSPEYQPDGELSRTKADRMARLGLEKGVHRFEWIHKRRDGSLFPVEVTLTSIVWLGKPSIYCTWRDISERKHQDKNLRLSQFSIDRATDAVYWLNPDGRVLMANQAACSMLGFSRDELLGKTVPDIDVNFTPELWREHWEHLKKEGYIRLESQQPRADGTVFPVEVSANYIQFEGQEYNCAILRDITERKQAEESLRRIEFSVNQSLDALFWIRADASFLDVNVAACESLGYPRETLLGLSVPEVDPAMSSDAWPTMWARLETEKTVRFESVHRTAGGRDFPVEISASYFTFGNEALVCAFVRDISDNKAAQAELQQRTHLLESAQAAAHLGYYLTDLNSRQWTSSPMLDDIMGIDATYDHTVDGWSQLVYPEDRQQATAEFEHAVQRQEPLHHQYRIVRPCDGKIIWVDAWGIFEYDQDRPVRIIGTVMDITERVVLHSE